MNVHRFRRLFGQYAHFPGDERSAITLAAAHRDNNTAAEAFRLGERSGMPPWSAALGGSLFDQQDERFGENAVVGHRICSVLRLHEAHHRVHVGNVH